MLRDLAYAARALRQTPAFSLSAIALLAIAIGGAAAVFTVTDTLIFRPLAVPHPEQLVRMINLLPGRLPVSYFPYPEFEEWSARTRTVYSTFAEADVDATFTETAGNRLIRAGAVSPGYFAALGITPALGRLFTPADESVAVVSHQFWQTHAAAPGAVLHLDGQPFVVVGVLPRGVNGLAVETGPAIRVPLAAGKYLARNGDANGWGSWRNWRQVAPRRHPAAGAVRKHRRDA